MLTDLQELFVMAILIVATAVVFVASLLIPILYFEGSAKSAWLKETRAMEVPWYHAAFLDIKINEVDAEVRTK